MTNEERIGQLLAVGDRMLKRRHKVMTIKQMISHERKQIEMHTNTVNDLEDKIQIERIGIESDLKELEAIKNDNNQKR